MPDKPESPAIARNIAERIAYTLIGIFEKPVVWVRENIVEPNQKQYPWYHQRFRRVPNIDQCYSDDPVCFFEANMQYKRDRLVDNEIVGILRQRFEDCVMYEKPDHLVKCKDLLATYEEATANWFTKYGDLGAYHNVKFAYMKQKHRMVWERRHGPVGSGMNGNGMKEEE